MGTGYTRNDTSNNIADGNIINAADFDGEYDAIEAAFNSSTGHTHDGTSAEGAPITVLGPSQEFVASSSEVKPSTNAGLDLGTSALKFKDLYIDGVAYIDGLGGDILAATDKKIQFRDTAIFINSSADGQLDIDADTTIELNSPEVIATDNFRLKSDAAILTFGADNDVTVTHVADTGLDAKAASGFALKLQTGDTTIESGNTLGKISFNAPDEASGTDSILVGAEIEAAAEATFSSTVNSTALVFKTNDSAAATERMRIKSDGDIVFTGASANMTWDTSADSLDFQDGGQVALGSDDDLVITHSGSAGSITNATGDFTIDAAADIILDADGQQIFFKKGGTTFGQFGTESTPTNFTIESTVSDGDIVFKGNDGGVTITALTLDMSEGGKATFAAGAATAFQGATTITTNDNTTQLTLESTDADHSPGPRLDFLRNSASPADDDYIGRMRFMGKNDADESIVGVDFLGRLIDVTDGTEDATLFIQTMVGGTNYNRLNITPTEIVINEESRDVDFRVETDNSSATLFVHGQYDGVGIHTTSPISYANAQAVLFIEDNTSPAIALSDTGQARDWYMVAQGSGLFFNYADGSNTGSSTNVTEAFQISNSSSGVIFNDGGADRDFRIESDSNSNALFVDANTSRTHINGSTDYGSGGSASGVLNVHGTDNNVTLNVVSTDSDAGTGPSIQLLRATSSPADGDITGEIRWRSFDSGGNSNTTCIIRVITDDVTDGSEDGRLQLMPVINDTATSGIEMSASGVVVNESSANLDFRVESDTKTHALFLDASTNILHLGGSTQLASTNFLNCGGVTFSNGSADGGKFLSWDNEGGTGAQKLIGYWYDGSAYKARFVLPGDTSEIAFNDSSEDLDFRIESNSKTDMFYIDGNNDAVSVNNTQTSYHFGIGADYSTNEGLFGVQRALGYTLHRLTGTGSGATKTVTIALSDYGLNAVELNLYVTGHKYNSGPNNFAVKMVHVAMEENGSMRINSDRTSDLGYRLGNQESKVGSVTATSTGGGNLTFTFTVDGEYDTRILAEVKGPAVNYISSISNT